MLHTLQKKKKVSFFKCQVSLLITGETTCILCVLESQETELLRNSGANIKENVFAFFPSMANDFAGAEITRDLWEACASCARFRYVVDQRGASSVSQSPFPSSVFP